jgi:hypothetical protein
MALRLARTNAEEPVRIDVRTAAAALIVFA